MRAVVAAAAACLCLGACSTAGMMPRQVVRQVARQVMRHADHHRPHIRAQASVAIGTPAAVDVRAAVTAAAIAEGVPVAIAHAVVKTESNYADAVNRKSGAAGPLQVLPRTAAEVGETVKTFAGRLRAGMKYLRRALDLPGATLCEKLSAYNRGIYARPRCTAYGRKVEARAKQ